METLSKLIDLIIGRVRPADPRVWHPWRVFIPVWTIDDRVGTGLDGQTLWRRLNADGKWEFQEDGRADDDLPPI